VTLFYSHHYSETYAPTVLIYGFQCHAMHTIHSLNPTLILPWLSSASRFSKDER